MTFLRDHESSGSVAVEESPQAQARGKAAPAHWTVLAYLAGDNDLEGALLDDLKEMERVGSRPGAVEILAQLDRAPGGDAFAGNWSGTRRYYVTRSASPSRIGSKLLADLGDANTGDPGVLEDFLSFGTRRFPARASMLVLSNHGSGFYVPPEMLSRRERRRGRAPQRTARGFFRTTRERLLGSSLPRGIAYDDGAVRAKNGPGSPPIRSRSSRPWQDSPPSAPPQRAIGTQPFARVTHPSSRGVRLSPRSDISWPGIAPGHIKEETSHVRANPGQDRRRHQSH